MTEPRRKRTYKERISDDLDKIIEESLVKIRLRLAEIVAKYKRKEPPHD